MARILILFASFDGQTARIAERIAAVSRSAGHALTVRSVDAPEAGQDIEAHDALIVGGAIRYGRFPRSLRRLARERAAAMASRPNAFFSVCLSARWTDKGPAIVERYIAKFRAETGWQPRDTVSFAGALPYSRYNPFLRFLMRLFSAAAGGDTQTARDYEYTDWAAVERFAAGFAARLEGPRPAHV